MKVIVFGQLTEITGVQSFYIDEAVDTVTLQKRLHEKFPALEDTTYRMAVDMKLVNENTAISKDTTIALLPPFSGG